jgi:hypothetical protein
MIAPFESVGAGGDLPLSDIVGVRSWLGRVRPRRRRWRSSEPGLFQEIGQTSWLC